MARTRLNPLFKWFGSKWQAARRYPAPEHGRIFEPYAGGAGYALNYSDHSVVLWDADPNLQVLWPWLMYKATSAAILEIPLGVPVGTDIRTLGLSRGQAQLLKHWQRTNNVGDCWTISPWGHLPGQWTANTRARVADDVECIKHWRFEPPDFGEVGTWFIDPPYLYNYKYRVTFPPFDHRRLARVVKALPPACQVIVCEARCPKTGTKPDYLPFADNHTSVTSRRKATQAHHSKELIYVRGSI